MRTAILLLAVAACGRIGFDARARGDGSTAGDDAPGDGSASGTRWAVTIGNNIQFVPVTGTAGAPVIGYGFQGSTTVAGQTVTGVGTFRSSVVARFDPSGSLTSTTVLDAATTCEVRGVRMRGDAVLAAVLAYGDGQATLGPCNISTGRQAPLVLSVDNTGTIARAAAGTPVGMNAQAWNLGVLPDGTYVTSGIYSGGLMFGTVSLPAAGADPNAWIARLSDSQADALWVSGITGGVQITPGPISVEGSEVCMLGGYAGNGLSAFGNALPYVGAVDELIARIDATGTPVFVRGFGSPGTESDFNEGSVIASGGGCIGSLSAPGDVGIDTTLLPATDGPGLVVWFDSTNKLIGGYRLPSTAELALVGTHVIGAYTISAPTMIGSSMVSPQGQDIVVVELDATGPTRLIDVIGGAGDQSVIRMAAIGPASVAVTLASSGDFQLGTTTFTSAANDRVLAVLGI